MNVPISWLQDYVTINQPVEKLADLLTFAGTKVESIRKKGQETILEFEITSNRPDTLSVIGIAREVAVVTNVKLRLPHIPRLQKARRAPFAFVIKDKTLCPRFSAILLENVEVKPSPPFMQTRLKHAGIQPINNVVDITNYVMLELGIPLHAFDFDRIHGTMTMRTTKKGEVIQTLNETAWMLPANAIVIQDENGLIDLAGLQGGKSSGITKKTSRVLLIAPIYDPVRIRRTSKFLGFRTEASTRFEKKLDLQAPPQALARAVDLLQEYSGATPLGNMVDRTLGSIYHPTINYPLDTSKKILGIEVSKKTAMRILTDLGCTVRARGKILKVTPPTFRRDLAQPEDLAEELGRILGYNNLPKTIPAGPIPTPKELFEENRIEKLRDHVVRLGFTEHIGSTLLSEEAMDKTNWHLDTAVPVMNPMAKDYARLRPSLLVSLLEAVQKNQRHTASIRLFEIGRVFTPTHDGRVAHEHTRLSLITTETDFAALRGIIDSIFFLLGITNYSARPVTLSDAHPDRALQIDGHTTFGEIHPDVCRRWNITGRLLFAEMNLSKLFSLPSKKQTYQKISPYPAAHEDLSFFLDADTPIGSVFAALERINQRHVKSIDLMDIFTGKPVPKGKKSVTIRITYQSLTHTLKQREIEAIREKIIRMLEKKFDATIRRGR